MEIVRTKASRVTDVLDGDARREIRVGEHGFVALVDVMPRFVPEGMTGDTAIVQAARVSYGEGTKGVSDDRTLIRYLMRHNHTTPFEMAEVKLHCAMPIAVARQWIRHRTANVNEYSARYSVVKDRFYVPDEQNVRAQSNTNKQGGDTQVDAATAQGFCDLLEATSNTLYTLYEEQLAKGVSRELARLFLPPNFYTEWYWKIDLHNLLHFLALRMDGHAQKEIRDYASAIYELVDPVFPISIEAFNDYHPKRGGLLLSRLEVEAIRCGRPIRTENRREREEFEKKFERLNLPHPEHAPATC